MLLCVNASFECYAEHMHGRRPLCNSNLFVIAYGHLDAHVHPLHADANLGQGADVQLQGKYRQVSPLQSLTQEAIARPHAI